MSQYKYHIEMSFLNGKTNLEIKPENIKSFFIDSDFENYIMATMYTVLHIDKNFYDEIIKNAKVASILLNIYKFSNDDATNTKLLTKYTGECHYFINSDINYNKELDYAGDNKDREDIYKEVHMGLIYKKCIEYNNQTNNSTISNTTMMNVVASYTQNMPLLIENFTYNDVLSQLIVPPKDSLFKTIDFLNSIKVFYSTPYRFFIEPGCMYLISSSGKAVQRLNEKYNTVVFRIHSILEDDADVLGMVEDDTNKFYSVDVNVLDTHYTVDNDTCKTMNSINSILNPGKENSLISLGAVQNTIKDVAKIKENILANIVKKIPDIKNTLYHSYNIKADIASSTQSVDENITNTITTIDAAIEKIKAAPASGDPDSGEGPLSAEIRQNAILALSEDKTALNVNRNSLIKVNDDISGSTNSIIANLGKTTTNIPSLINSITPINMNDNISAIKKLSGGCLSESTANLKFIDDNIAPQINTGIDINSIMSSVKTNLTSLGIPDLEKEITSIGSFKDIINGDISTIISGITNFKSMASDINSVHKGMTPSVGKLDNIKVNLKDQFTNMKQDIQSSLNKNKSSLASIIGSGGDVINMLKSKGLSLNTLSSVSKDINKVLDISQIGKIGVSKFDVDLAFDEGVSGGSKVLKIDNDNTNRLKNIKASMENKANRLTLNKNDLDVSVTTINKEYIIKNYDAHSNKDGKFILTRKVEVFIRQDDKFTLNTILSFDKVSDENKDSNKATELGKQKVPTEVKNTVDTDNIIKNAASILDTIKTKGINKDSISSIIKDSGNITKQFNQLKGKSTSSSLSSIINDTKIF